jgi:transcriptional regulator with XRE-family HTH domain
LRYRECLTQKQLAEKMGINTQNLSHMEHGRRPVGKEMAKRFAKILNTDRRLLLS